MARGARADEVTGSRAERRGRRRGTPGRYARLSVALVVGIVGADQATKAWAVRSLKAHSVAVVGRTVLFELGRNTGSAFSLFQNFTPLLALLALAVALVLARAARRSDDLLTVVALSLVLGGSLGNLGDRLFRAPGFLHGAVVDFIRIGWWPTFNIADSAITVGALLLVVLGWRGPRRSGDAATST